MSTAAGIGDAPRGRAPGGRLPARAGAYAAVAAVAARQELAERGALVARVLFQGVILLIFSRLWAVVADEGALGGRVAADFVWYLAITEWIVLSGPLLHLDIEADFRTGDVAARLPRPISYLGSRLAEGAGTWAVRGPALAVSGVAYAWLLTGRGPEDPGGLWLAIPLGVLAAAVSLLFVAGVGVTTVWLQDTSPAWWIWQKASFVLGGLMLPLEIYPAWLRGLAAWLPFAPMIHGPGRMAFGLAPDAALATAVKLLLWGALAAIGLAALYRAGLRRLDVNGG